MSYKQLTLEKRYEIRAYMQAGFSQNDIAGFIGVHKSTITREIQRNTGLRGYRPRQAHQKAMERMRAAAKHIRFTPYVKNKVESLLGLDFSPDQISNYLYLHHHIRISHERIYQHIWADKQLGGDLYKHLRTGRRKNRKRYGNRDNRGQIADRRRIEERPDIVDKKARIGDWEIDTIIGKNHKGAIITAVERKTLYTCISHVPSRKAEIVANAIIRMFKPFKEKVLTITADNGKEFSGHKQISDALDTDFYFADPYSAWQRGLNEHTNGLLRQYFPKKMKLESGSQLLINSVETRLNIRPRKTLEYKSPMESFLNLKVALGT
ncbi:MAG: IS30 family transposase [Candidatus Hodarchaeales archaeon]|jgi:IS30 family transposase